MEKYKFQAKSEEGLLEKALTELNVKKDEIITKTYEEKGGLFSGKKYTLEVVKLSDVAIDGYKNLSNIRLKFNNITALVSVNNFGKSNVISAIDFAFNFIKASSIEKINMMSNSNFFPMNKSLLLQDKKVGNYKFEVSGTVSSKEDNYDIIYGYEFVWKVDETVEPKIVKEYLKIKQDIKGARYTQIIQRDENKALYKRTKKGRCISPISIGKSDLVINKLKAYDDYVYNDLSKQINDIKMYFYNNVDKKSNFRKDTIVHSGLENENIDIDKLPRIVYDLNEKYENKYMLLKDAFLTLFPNIEDLIIKKVNLNRTEDVPISLAGDNIYLLYVKDKYLIREIDFKLLSAGTKRIFLLLTRIIISSITDNIPLIAIEEPENSINPSLFQSFLRIVNILLDDCKLIITSHSPHIISYLSTNWLYIGIDKSQMGIASFYKFSKKGQKQLDKDANEYDMSMGDYLFTLLEDDDNAIDEYIKYS